MTDIVSPETRSRMMSGIRGKNTRPEMILRQGLHALGFRFRLHDRKLPGRPDLVFPKYKAVIHANGCFWHGHDCHLFRMPASRVDFWRAKIARNKANDESNSCRLHELGWRQGIVWECALKGRQRLSADVVIGRCADWLVEGNSDLQIRGKERA